MTAPRPDAPRAPATVLDLDLIAALRADLVAILPDILETVLGEEAAAALAREMRVPGLIATSMPTVSGGGETARAVARLFLLGADVPRTELDRALPTLGCAGALRLGLVAPARPDAVVAAVDLQPVQLDDSLLWFAADLGERHTGRAVHPDHVLSVGGASRTLASLSIRRPVRRALDLGTGCGIQAAQLAGHAETVVATDISARALGFAAFNAALNGQRWDLRRGSLLAPVAGEEFDLVVSNPPFVITPTAAITAGLPRLEYRDAGRSGDDLLAGLVRQIPSHLAPGGVAQFLGNWEHHRGEDWRERVAAWAAGSGLDLWVVQRELLDPAEYVEMWLRDGGLAATADRPLFEAAYSAWLTDFHDRGVEAIGFGYLMVRRHVAPRAPWVRVEVLTGPTTATLGDHVAATLDAVEWLAGAGDDALGAARLAAAPDVTLEHHFRPGEPEPAVILARQGGGFGRVVQLDTALAGFVGACDGELAVDQLVGALAALLEVSGPALAEDLVPRVRDLVADGFLTRA